MQYYFVAIDKAGNKAQSDLHSFKVRPNELPYILLILALVACATAASLVYVIRKGKFPKWKPKKEKVGKILQT